MIDDISIIPHQPSESLQRKTYFNPAKEKPFTVKVEAPQCPSPDEDYEDTKRLAEAGDHCLKRKKHQWQLLLLFLMKIRPKNLRKKERGNLVHWALMYAMFVGKIIPVNQI